MVRRGKKRAIMAVAHAIAVAAYHMLRRNESYRDLGGSYFDDRRRESIVNRLVHRLEKFGYQVALEVVPTAAAQA